MDTAKALKTASSHLIKLQGHTFDVLSLSKPVSSNAALNLVRVVSKLSPLVGNLIEFNIVELLNDVPEFSALGSWRRQDPGFPDAVFDGPLMPVPGFEIKAWFPLATEITARFRDSQNHFTQDNTYVAMLAWLPEQLIFGKPKILAVCIASGRSIAQARDQHYHNPPDYLVLEPEDTTLRTRNLRQTNTAGFKWQGTKKEFEEASKIVESWGANGKLYKPTPEYQKELRGLLRLPYRLDTNFAKIDRIVHPEIEAFKTRVYNMSFASLSVQEWIKVFSRGSDAEIRTVLKDHLNITDEDADQLVV